MLLWVLVRVMVFMWLIRRVQIGTTCFQPSECCDTWLRKDWIHHIHQVNNMYPSDYHIHQVNNMYLSDFTLALKSHFKNMFLHNLVDTNALKSLYLVETWNSSTKEKNMIFSISTTPSMYINDWRYWKLCYIEDGQLSL